MSIRWRLFRVLKTWSRSLNSMLVSLVNVLDDALAKGYAVPCFNVFGYEDARAVVAAAEQSSAPVIMATNHEMTEFMGAAQAASMLGKVAEASKVPVCVHLDHCYEVDSVKAAVDAGYSSVMFDGSQLPLSENIAKSAQVVEYAHAAGVSVEVEIGSVPYDSGRDHIKAELTDPTQAQQLALDSGADAVAISVGNVHRLQSTSSRIDFDRLAEIEPVVEQPLVIHGTSGIRDEDMKTLAARRVCKFNIGTTLRMAFGQSLRGHLQQNPDDFDRLTIMNGVMPAMTEEATRNISLLGADGKANN